MTTRLPIENNAPEDTSEQQGFIVDGRVVNDSGNEKLGEHDVLLGRGLGTYNHVGNIKFRKLVNKHKMRYLACSKVEKPKVARELVQMWRKLDPPGRFLQRKDDKKDADWQEVGDKKAQEKASQCLRERTPDVLPYYQFLRACKKKRAKEVVGAAQVQPAVEQQHQQPVSLGGLNQSAGINMNSRLEALQRINLLAREKIAVAPQQQPQLSNMLRPTQPPLSTAGAVLLQREAQKQALIRQLLLQQQQQQRQRQLLPHPSLQLESLAGLIRPQQPSLGNLMPGANLRW